MAHLRIVQSYDTVGSIGRQGPERLFTTRADYYGRYLAGGALA